MEEAKKAIAKVAKKIGKAAIKIVSTTLVPVIIFVVILSAALYWLTVDDGTYAEDDWSSVPYAAAQYVNDTEVDEDGTISSNKSTQEVWDTMEVNKSRVSEYLDSPEELARLMRAEIITKYPDTRKNPDEAINWEEIIKNADSLQGIVKFKRADTNGNKSTMIYASPQEFQGYIDEYNRTGSEIAKQNALSHFTLKKSGTKTIINYTGPELYWPTDGTKITSYFGLRNDPVSGSGQENHGAIDIGVAEGTNIYACETGKVTTAGWSDSAGNWVVIDHGNGYVSKYMHNSQLKVSAGETVSKGQVIALSGNTGHSTGPHCHFQIEYKDIKVDPLSFKYNNGQGNGTGGFGISNNKAITDLKGKPETDNTQNNGALDLKNQQKAEAVTVNGDGYKEQYTSSAGITYKHYKQYEGSYAESEYWGGTIHNSGCGPTSIAILASGLTNLDKTPGVIATEMNSTSYDTLQQEMNSLGMISDVIQNPTAEDIQENLRNGKVMLVSVNNNTIFTENSHIMALVDINSAGQVYICNPGSSTLYGWYDISEIMKGCKYIVVTDAGATGIASSTNASEYTAVVATWRQIDTTIITDDPNVEKNPSTQYTMTATDVNYEEMVRPYTMPFDLLWALLVVGEDKNFIFELTDLIYNSDIQITIHDNLTTDTDVDEWHYTQKTKAVVDATITADCNGKTETDSISNDIHDPHAEVNYTTTKTIVTKTNSVMPILTRANVWIVDYKNDYIYVAPTQTSTTNIVTQEDQEYPENPNSTGDTYTCEHITVKKQELETKVKQKAKEAKEAAEKDLEKATEAGTPKEVGMEAVEVTGPTGTKGATGTSQTIDDLHVNFKEEIAVKYYDKYVGISDNMTDTISTQKYVQGIPEVKEKTDANTAPNFVTIFNKSEYRDNKSRIKDASSWLFEIIETNNSTKNWLDIVKYLLYKSSNVVYNGIEYIDFTSIFCPSGLSTVAEGDYIVDIRKSSPDIVIKDVETLKKAFSGYSNSAKLIEHAQEFLDLQEQYSVNAVFAAAVSISETTAGTAGHAVDGKNNWFNIECVHGGSHGRFESYGSAKESIEAFYQQISVKNYYFTAGKYTVTEIGMTYCENADAPGGWIENTLTFMTQMFNAAGITPTTSGTNQTGTKIIEAAKSKLNCPYEYAASGPDKFDCSGLTMWVYKQVGINIPHNSEQQKDAATKVVSVSEARVGDILWRNGHVAIFIGNNQYIHAPQEGDVVKIADDVATFTYALQFY